MIAIVRTIFVVLLSITICIFGLIYCLFSPRDPRHVATFGRWFGSMSPMFGIQLKVRYPEGVTLPQNCIYIANHQNNYDMVTAAYVVQPRTVTVGKKSLLWMPLFGLLYWLTGNLLIDRDNNTRAHSTINKIVQHIKKRNISIWMFPEGTRSRGRGLLPFKTGAFYAAIAAEVPIVPICVSNTSNKIKLNRWSNGLVIIEILPPIDTASYNRAQVRVLTRYCRNLMKNKLDELNVEVAKIEALDER
ncbi:1-acylglycerol-3-phosphate O-acyltransferase [Sodalis endosymbiont of Henestaris halophilus]|uniref:1-acylglycerol-3-phosphate O-acyltransferase n=1 Tax=Sodalis endosymbiont of Henestaris halophilus TaxID=1929246 RepID=UPI000BC0455B|nr:1-acylglycerol-3-phosphate O-acyltransferase [Sodalis endosymbiont of Henestaris halophilus]SNC58997.1 1-acyl-sn-glycerol-3-phosphate acyltransferase [Sodalis endosymbiont of Henestaris halophilus]